MAGAAATITGAGLLLQVAAIRLLFRAGETSVSLLGRELRGACEFKQRFGLPCPTCGASRAVVLSAWGHFGQAWSLNPLGPLLVFGLLLTGVLLLGVAVAQRYGSGEAAKRASAMVRVALLAYGSAVCVIWIGSWVSAVIAAVSR